MLDNIGPTRKGGGTGIAERQIFGRNQDICCLLFSNHATHQPRKCGLLWLDGSSLAGYWFGDLTRLMTNPVTREPMARKLARNELSDRNLLKPAGPLLLHGRGGEGVLV